MSSRKMLGEAPLVMQSMTLGLDLTLSIVVDEFGSTVNEHGNSAGIGNSTDLELLKALRLNADVVLTSGTTFRADEYRFPKSSDLAVLSKREPEIEVPANRRFHWLTSGYAESIEELRDLGYNRIQVEFGVSGLSSLIGSHLPITIFISSTSENGLRIFLKHHRLPASNLIVNDLFLAVVAWQNPRKQAAR